MLFQIYLLQNGASSIPETYYVESESKELALNALVFQKHIDLTRYQTVLVVDISLHIIKDTTKENLIKPTIQNDFDKPLLDLVLDYDKQVFKSIIKIEGIKFSLFESLRHGLINFNSLKDIFKENNHGND